MNDGTDSRDNPAYQEQTPCARCGRDDILDDATQLCMSCHIVTAAERRRWAR